MKLKKNIFITIATFLVYNESCKPKNVVNPEIVFKSILNKCTSPDTTIKYKLDTILNFEWDKMIILTPYFNRTKLEKCAGVSIPKSTLENTEGVNEYLFIKDKKVEVYVSSNNKELDRIALTFNNNFYTFEKLQLECGIVNNSNLYIKLTTNKDPEWAGKTFLIFNK
jgi:hypothetical protein